MMAVKEMSARMRRYVYEYLTGAMLVKCNGEAWKVSTPQETTTFATRYEMDKFIEENLTIMEGLVEAGQIENELWSDAQGFAEACMYEDDIANDMCGYHDPLDKPATEITVWDVYSPSELL